MGKFVGGAFGVTVLMTILTCVMTLDALSIAGAL